MWQKSFFSSRATFKSASRKRQVRNTRPLLFDHLEARRLLAVSLTFEPTQLPGPHATSTGTPPSTIYEGGIFPSEAMNWSDVWRSRGTKYLLSVDGLVPGPGFPRPVSAQLTVTGPVDAYGISSPNPALLTLTSESANTRVYNIPFINYGGSMVFYGADVNYGVINVFAQQDETLNLPGASNPIDSTDYENDNLQFSLVLVYEPSQSQTATITKTQNLSIIDNDELGQISISTVDGSVTRPPEFFYAFPIDVLPTNATPNHGKLRVTVPSTWKGGNVTINVAGGVDNDFMLVSSTSGVASPQEESGSNGAKWFLTIPAGTTIVDLEVQGLADRKNALSTKN
jgi:hypothetical protein